MNIFKSFSFKVLLNYLLRGIFIIAPVFFTGYALYKLFLIIDSPIQEIFYYIFGFRIYGLGLVSTLLILVMAGFLGSTLIIDTFFKRFEKLLFKIPLVKEIYKAIRDIFGAFVSDKKKFDKPVIVEVSNGVYRIGFITNEDLSSITTLDLVAVYFPLSYAFTGELLFIKRTMIQHLESNKVGDLMKYVISGGVIDHEETKKSN
jgi:uncharacterized membrane protein